jgi:hypothetical protein
MNTCHRPLRCAVVLTRQHIIIYLVVKLGSTTVTGILSERRVGKLVISLKFLGVGRDCVHLVRRPLFCLFCKPRKVDHDECGAVGEWEFAWETEVLWQTCPNATLFTTYLTWLDMGSNRGRRGGKPATHRLSNDTA